MCAAIAWPWLSCSPEPPAGSSPGEAAPSNVLLIVVDTLRADHLSFYGYPRETPAIDALARQSVVFSDAMSSAPVTVPSVLQILTGEPLIGRAIPHTQPTLAEILRTAGYQTLAVIDNPILELRETGVERGFERFAVNGVLDERLNEQLWKTSTPADVITRRAMRWLDTRGDERPFFLWLHYFDPHDPYFPPYTQDVPFAAADGASRVDGDIRRHPAFDRGNTEPVSEADRRRWIDLYDAEIRYLDDSLADLFDYLRERGWFDDTLVVLTSDHGESFGEHGEWTHGRSLRQSQIHVPLIVKLPEPRTVHRVVTSPVSLTDLVPTLCANLAIACPPGAAGRDLLAREPEATYALWNYRVLVREGRWKLVHHTVTGETTLYDLEADPGEEQDRSGDEPVVRDRLRALEDAWLAERWPSLRDALETSAEQVEQLEALGYLE